MATTMANPQWETVGKTKKPKQSGSGLSEVKLTKNEKKRLAEKAPKVEDILPLDQVASLYNAFEVRPSQLKHQVTEHKKPEQKKVVPKKSKSEKPIEEKKRVPRTFEEAVKKVTADDLHGVLKLVQTKFPNNGHIWLKDLASYLNLRMGTEDYSLTTKRPFYASNLLPHGMKQILNKLLRQCKESTLISFTDECITLMAQDMSRGLSTNGFKIFIELIAQFKPDLMLNSLNNVNEVWKSYHNRQNIGIALLWAVGEAGHAKFSVGIDIWLKFMLPAINLRLYTKFVIGYLDGIFTFHYMHSLRDETDAIAAFTIEEFLRKPTDMPSDSVRKELTKMLPDLQALVMNCKDAATMSFLFTSYFNRLSMASPDIQAEILLCLTTCLEKEPDCFLKWVQLYRSRLRESALLLQHLNSLWPFETTEISKKSLQGALQTFKRVNEELKKGKGKQDALQRCSGECQALFAKMGPAATPHLRYGMPLILFVCLGMILADVYLHGGFQVSKTAACFRALGMLEYMETTAKYVKNVSNITLIWIKKNCPHYYYLYGEPLMKLVYEGFFIAMSQLADAMGTIGAFMRVKVPQLLETMRAYAPNSFDYVCSLLDRMLTLFQYYGENIMDIAMHYVFLCINWMRVNVFVGEFEPQHLKKYAFDMLASAQHYVTILCNWLTKQINFLAN